MKRSILQVAAAVVLVAVTADVALASFLPGPFTFSFFTQGLTELFLLPLALAGCG